MKKYIIGLILLLLSPKVFAFEPPNLPADVALQRLKDGNERFATYTMKHPNMDKKRRFKVLNGQHPYALIVTCSDSRVTPEMIFDQGIGDLFVIRNAGNVIDEHVMGSIEYAVYHLGVNLVLVMGHESCGVIGAVMRGEHDRPDIQSVLDLIVPAVEKCKESNSYSYENVIKTHAKLSAEEVLSNKELREYSIKHDLKILPAYYSLSTGRVEILKP